MERWGSYWYLNFQNNPNVSACVDNNKSFQQNILPAVQLVGSHLDFSSSELIVQVSFSDHVLLGLKTLTFYDF